MLLFVLHKPSFHKTPTQETMSNYLKNVFHREKFGFLHIYMNMKESNSAVIVLHEKWNCRNNSRMKLSQSFSDTLNVLVQNSM